MDNSIFALLVLAALAALAGPAAAQSSVTVYGRIDLGLVVDSGTPAGKSVRLSTGVAKGSALGFKGQEDLGGGYQAGFQLETGYCADSAAAVVSNGTSVPNFCTGSNTFMGRQARGDLRGPFGTLSAGRQYVLAYQSMLLVDAFLGTAGQMNNIMDSSGLRLSNSLRYTTPTWAGFNVAGEIALGETTGNWAASRETGGAVRYTSSAAYVGLIYNDLRNTNGIGVARANLMLGGTYDFEVLKLHALAQRTTGNPTGAALKLDVLDLMAGLSVPLAGGRAMASYVRHDDRTPLAKKGDKDANLFAVGYSHALSKRVTAYTAYGRIVNDNGASFKVGNATEAGVGTRSFNLGVGYDF